jgi:hypothetical protein
MAMAVSNDNALALTVSADHIIGRYDLAVGRHGTLFITRRIIHVRSGKQTSPLSVGTTHRTKYPGNSAIAIRGDGKVCAVGGWDGKWVNSVKILSIIHASLEFGYIRLALWSRWVHLCTIKAGVKVWYSQTHTVWCQEEMTKEMTMMTKTIWVKKKRKREAVGL